ncbi:MAG: acyltransferase [Lachnospiraceae bacterium]|nr:acyltransferase [Lachnospiraceae bacterium]
MLKEKILMREQNRDSSIEIFRIITMICIIAHHYVVNSGILEEITRENIMSLNTLFSLVFGWGGKTGINCFVLITGYFMCKLNISIKKFLKLFLEIEFYNIILSLAFIVSGYDSFSWSGFIKTIVPVYDLGTGFVSSYLVFYLFIPYLNLLIKVMEEIQHIGLILVCLFCGMLLQTFFVVSNTFSYVGWFMVLYFIASYIRLYPKRFFEDRRLCIILFVMSLLLSWGSVIFNAYIYAKWGIRIRFYRFVDTNRILAVLTAVSAFLFFKNLHLKHCPIINKFAASVFGVLLIHANSDIMRKWLWQDVLRNVQAYHSNYLLIHAFTSVIGIYVIATFIDMLRIKVLERPFFNWYDRVLDRKINLRIQDIERLLQKVVGK